MSALGNYIHYHYINYLRAGTNQISKDANFNKGNYLAKVKTEQERIIRIKASEQKEKHTLLQSEFDEYINFITTFQNPNLSGDENFKKYNKAYQEAFYEVMFDASKKGFTNLMTDGGDILKTSFQNQKSNLLDQIDSKLRKNTRDVLNHLTGGSSYYKSSITKDIKAIVDFLNDNNIQKIGNSNDIVNQIRNNLNIVLQKLNEAIGDAQAGINKYFNRNSYSNISKAVNALSPNIKIGKKTNDNIGKIIEELLGIRQLMTYPNISGEKGISEEAIAEIMKLYMEGQLTKKARKIKKK